MSGLISGSLAAQHWGVNRRTPSDSDRVAPIGSELKKGWDTTFVSQECYDLLLEHSCDGYLTKDALYTLKCSHFAWSIHWQKTKLDILFMKSKGCKLIPDLYQALKHYWESVNGDKDFLSLSQNKKDFFNDHVVYVYDHDYLHELVALPQEPAYKQCLKDGNDVLTDYNKFMEMSDIDKVRMFREEISVIAAERWLLPPKIRGKLTWYEAYTLSLEKTITRLTKNWACDYLIHNLELFVVPDFKYFKTLYEKLGELKMAKVDIELFTNLQEELMCTDSLDHVVLLLCEGDTWLNCSRQFAGDYQAYRIHVKNVLDKYGYEHLEQEGGGEGGSEYCYGVFRLNDTIYRGEYSYYSYDGHEYDNITETLTIVKPVEKLLLFMSRIFCKNT